MACMSDYLENKLVDWLLRGQAFTPPTNTYAALLTAAPSDAGGGTEVSGGNYARVAIASGLTTWAGTQGAGTTVASTGTSGTTSNNAAITFPVPSADWGRVTHFALFDAASGGNLLLWGALTAAKNVSNGDSAPVIASGALTYQIDN